MAKTVTISDDLAELLEKRRQHHGYASLDAAAEAMIADGIASDEELDGYSAEELRALIAEADEDDTEIEWDAEAVRAEMQRRSTEKQKRT